MGPPGGARNAVDPRFISLFMAFNVQFPSNQNLNTIYDAILSSHVVKFPEAIISASKPLTSLTLELYEYIVDHLPPTPSRFHYIFNLRDLSRIYEVCIDLKKTLEALCCTYLYISPLKKKLQYSAPWSSKCKIFLLLPQDCKSFGKLFGKVFELSSGMCMHTCILD